MSSPTVQETLTRLQTTTTELGKHLDDLRQGFTVIKDDDEDLDGEEPKEDRLALSKMFAALMVMPWLA